MFSVFKYFRNSNVQSKTKKFLVVGLGNIGKKYEKTRHNIGFDIVDQLAIKLNSTFSSAKYGEVLKTKFAGKQIVLLKPNTFMNLSGKAVLYWLKKEKIDVNNLIIIVDDLNLDFGISRLRKSGSDGGHNGLKDISNSLNSTKFTRLRFGIGNNYKKEKQVDFVLSKWNIEESAKLKYHLDKNVEIILSSLKKGLEFTMNKYN
ncbi:MAG: aminoacyl-tRNA hydrolase [Flavobacteriaceae bacterium TMED238]|nr:aminoacyl-tRNA hydrolase [Flavobacteriales bacterium]RPG63017.1 MAG: aminoacyl-tRNA hydrolase [Flavobacteriaceae bacterium TMED238]